MKKTPRTSCFAEPVRPLVWAVCEDTIKYAGYDVDTLSFLRSKADRLSTLLPKSGILAVLRHIDIGERHFDRARKGGETDLFVDVICRTNRAFEGILRESFAILAKCDPANKKAYEIESYLSKNNIFHERVMELFTNYRTKWRNPSTHDHQAVFIEAEAFLALLSVTAFVGMLIDQMIERLAFEREQARLASISAELREAIVKHSGEPFVDRITWAIERFASQDVIGEVESELELAANLRAFLASALPDVQWQEGLVLRDNLGPIRPDFLITEGGEVAVIELKRYRLWNTTIQQAAKDQIRRYIEAADAHLGIVLAAPTADAEIPAEKYRTTLFEPLADGRCLVMIRMLPSQDRKTEST